LIPESQQDSDVEVLHSFDKLTNIDGKVQKRRKNEEESDVDSDEEVIKEEEDINEEDFKNDEEEDIKEEEEAFSPPEFGDLQSIRERCKALILKIIDESRHETLEETLVKWRRHTTTLSQPNPSTELLERDARKKPEKQNK
jgi:hypothetical protein